MSLRNSKYYMTIYFFIIVFASSVFADIAQNGLFDYSMLPEKKFIDYDIPRKTLDQSIGILQQLIKESPSKLPLT